MAVWTIDPIWKGIILQGGLGSTLSPFEKVSHPRRERGRETFSTWLYLERGLVGAGDENRTHMISLEGWGSTIELRPRIFDFLKYDINTKYQMNF